MPAALSSDGFPSRVTMACTRVPEIATVEGREHRQPRGDGHLPGMGAGRVRVVRCRRRGGCRKWLAGRPAVPVDGTAPSGPRGSALPGMAGGADESRVVFRRVGAGAEGAARMDREITRLDRSGGRSHGCVSFVALCARRWPSEMVGQGRARDRDLPVVDQVIDQRLDLRDRQFVLVVGADVRRLGDSGHVVDARYPAPRRSAVNPIGRFLIAGGSVSARSAFRRSACSRSCTVRLIVVSGGGLRVCRSPWRSRTSARTSGIQHAAQAHSSMPWSRTPLRRDRRHSGQHPAIPSEARSRTA